MDNSIYNSCVDDDYSRFGSLYEGLVRRECIKCADAVSYTYSSNYRMGCCWV